MQGQAPNQCKGRHCTAFAPHVDVLLLVLHELCMPRRCSPDMVPQVFDSELLRPVQAGHDGSGAQDGHLGPRGALCLLWRCSGSTASGGCRSEAAAATLKTLHCAAQHLDSLLPCHAPAAHCISMCVQLPDAASSA